MFKKLLLVTLFLILTVSAPIITRSAQCPPPSDNFGNSPTPVTRLSEINMIYSLVKEASSHTGYPQLNDRFYLPVAQKVKVSYSIVVPLKAEDCYLETYVKIDNAIRKQLNVMTGNCRYTTNRASADVYLQKGEHYFQVLYWTACDIKGVDTSHQMWYGGLQIDYLDYPSQ